MRIATLVTTIALVACSDAGPVTPDPDPDPPANRVAVAFAGGTVRAEIAASRAARSTGLSNRTSIAADSGMLFIWATEQHPQLAPFWMKDTHFDLAIAFLDANKVVISISEMTRDTETLHFAGGFFRYALEAPKGWFAAHGVTAGATANFTLPAGVIIEP
jgi:uncharacterized membrane protein (UPF0127 family)